MTKKEEINGLIESLIVEKTFSLEIVDKIKNMRDEYLVMEQNIEQTTKLNKELVEQNNKLNSENIALKAHDIDVSAREKIVIEKEAKQAINDLKLEHANQRATEIKEMFSIVFKNPVIRETAYKNTSKNVNNYGSSGSETGNDNEGKTIERE